MDRPSSWWCARTMHNALWQSYSLDPNGYRAQSLRPSTWGHWVVSSLQRWFFEFRAFPRSMTSGSFVQSCWQSRLHSPLVVLLPHVASSPFPPDFANQRKRTSDSPGGPLLEFCYWKFFALKISPKKLQIWYMTQVLNNSFGEFQNTAFITVWFFAHSFMKTAVDSFAPFFHENYLFFFFGVSEITGTRGSLILIFFPPQRNWNLKILRFMKILKNRNHCIWIEISFVYGYGYESFERHLM